MIKPLIVIPSSNERRNLEILYRDIRNISSSIPILIVDDASSDGTEGYILTLSKSDPNLFIICREKLLGIGNAHKTGIEWGISKGFLLIGTMDGDGLHLPKDMFKVLDAIVDNPVVVGDRFGELIDNRSLFRRFLTYSLRVLIRGILGIRFDASNGLRGYNFNLLEYDLILNVQADNYDFFIESAYNLVKNKIPVKEVPVTLQNRIFGESKMTLKQAIRTLNTILQITKR